MTLHFTGFKQQWLGKIGLLALCGLLFTLPYFSIVKYYNSDPELTLLVSQTILEHGTTRLDRYQDQVVLGRPFATFINSRKIVERGGHLYNYFPTGPAVLSLPAVAIARAGGWDMSRVQGNYVLQGYLAALSVVIVFLIMYQTARFYLDDKTSLLISLTATLGSTIVSTMGTALWSINFATIFVALSLYLLAKGTNSWSRYTPYGLGVLLFLAFCARVSAATFIAPVLLYLFLYERRMVWATAIAALIPLILFLVWSRLEFGEWLPAYYSAARLQAERVAMWVGVFGNLWSPSRGIFVFSPFLGLGVVASIVCWRQWRQRPLIPLILLWFVLLLLIIARGASWWGGVSFGPRILTELIPGLTLLVVLGWRELASLFSRQQRRFWLAIYTGLAALAIVIHGFQGLYNSHATRWNQIIDPIPDLPVLGWGDLFNWRYSQLLASPDWNCGITRDRTLTFLENVPVLRNYEWGQEIRYPHEPFADSVSKAIQQMEAEQVRVFSEKIALPDAGDYVSFFPLILNMTASKGTNWAVLLGLQAPENIASLPETYCRALDIVFQLDESLEAANKSYVLALTAGSYGEQPLVLEVNGSATGEQIVDKPASEPGTVMFLIPGHLLNLQGLNEVTIQLPEAQFTGLRGSGYSGLAFVQASLYEADAGNSIPAETLPLPAYP